MSISYISIRQPSSSFSSHPAQFQITLEIGISKELVVIRSGWISHTTKIVQHLFNLYILTHIKHNFSANKTMPVSIQYIYFRALFLLLFLFQENDESDGYL